MDWSVITENYQLFFQGTLSTIALVCITMLVSVSVAIPLALLRESNNKPLAFVAAAYSWITRAIPALVFLYFSYYGLPFWGIKLNPMAAAIIGLTLSAAGYNMEFFRAGFRSINKGQIDAARALGMSRLHTLRRIIFPQALRVTVPPLFSNLTLVLKGSSLAGLVSVGELTGAANALISYTYQPIEILLVVSIIYLLLNSILVMIQRYIESRLKFQ